MCSRLREEGAKRVKITENERGEFSARLLTLQSLNWAFAESRSVWEHHASLTEELAGFLSACCWPSFEGRVTQNTRLADAKCRGVGKPWHAYSVALFVFGTGCKAV